MYIFITSIFIANYDYSNDFLQEKDCNQIAIHNMNSYKKIELKKAHAGTRTDDPKIANI
jgi:hypothetical protein